MSERAPFSSSEHERIEATAAAWLAESDSGLTPDRAREFARWRAADPRHEAAAFRLEQTWALLQPLREFRPSAHVHPDRNLLVPERRPPGRRFGWAVAGVAAVLALAFLALWRPRGPDASAAAARSYVTVEDGFQRVALVDGSVVELNANSKVEVDYTPAERRVRLIAGEAHFSVAKNRARPFIVEAGRTTVRAVGTKFDVRWDERAVDVLVTEGSVKLNASGPASAADAPTLAAGQRALVAASVLPGGPAFRLERMTSDQMREALAWREPQLVFAETPLGEVIDQFNRCNRVQLSLDDERLAALPVTGRFQAQNVEGFVRLLANNNEFVVSRPDSTHIMLRPAK